MSDPRNGPRPPRTVTFSVRLFNAFYETDWNNTRTPGADPDSSSEETVYVRLQAKKPENRPEAQEIATQKRIMLNTLTYTPKLHYLPKLTNANPRNPPI